MGVTLVYLDVAMSPEYVDDLWNLSKVSQKDRPTLLLRANDSLHKIPASCAVD
jgi:hypothetical protein